MYQRIQMTGLSLHTITHTIKLKLSIDRLDYNYTRYIYRIVMTSSKITR